MLAVEHGAPHGGRLITTEPFGAGQVIARIPAARRAPRPTYRSIQIGPDAHVEDLGDLCYLNHSCRPNCAVDTETLRLVAGRDIAAGEELTYFYPSTEWEMDRPFRCLCGAPGCVGIVAGAKALPPEALRRFTLAPHIRRLMALAPEPGGRGEAVRQKRVLLVCPTSWDEAQLEAAGPGLERRYALLRHGEDAEDDPARFPLLSFVAGVVERYRGRIDGVTSSSDYPGCLVAAAVAQELGLPGPAPEALLRCSHKYYARLAQQEAVPEATPRFALVDPRRLDRHAPGLAFPCFVKPVKSWFSILAQPVGSFEELQAFVARPDVRAHLSAFVAPFNQFIARYSDLPLDGGYLLAEEPLRGDQVTVEGFVCGGQVTVTGIVDSVMFPGTISFRRFDYPSRLAPAVQARMTEIVLRVVRHVGLDDSLFNVELFHDPATGRVTIIEINPRMVGQFADLREMVDGTNTYEVLLAVAAGEPPALRRAAGRFPVAASFPLRAFEDRRVLRVPGAARLAGVRRRRPVSVVKVYCRPGHWLSEEGQSDGLTHRYGVVNMGGRSLEALLAEFAAVEGELGFAFESGASGPSAPSARLP